MEQAARDIFFTIDEKSALDVRQVAEFDHQIRFGQVDISNITFGYNGERVPIL